MQASDMVLLVRDAKTGRILVKPPAEEYWLLPGKSGVGRASKNEWKVLKRVGPELFKQVEDQRDWHFGFTEYYDIWIGDYGAGQCCSRLYNGIQEVSTTARVEKPSRDMLLTSPVVDQGTSLLHSFRSLQSLCPPLQDAHQRPHDPSCTQD